MTGMTRFLSDEAVTNWFIYHPPADHTIAEAHDRIRAEFRALALSMNDVLPEGPDKTVALRAIREAMYHCNAAIACAQATGSDDRPAANATMNIVLPVPDAKL